MTEGMCLVVVTNGEIGVRSLDGNLVEASILEV